MKIKSLAEIKKVRFNDFSDYEPEKCNNGGEYGFWTDYKRLENGLFEVSYGTTADFQYCPVCGSFQNHSTDDDYYDSGYSCGEFETVTERELIDMINEFDESDDCYIEFLE